MCRKSTIKARAVSRQLTRDDRMRKFDKAMKELRRRRIEDIHNNKASDEETEDEQ